MSKALTPDEALAVLAKVPADSPTGRALRETMADAMAARRHVKDLQRRVRLARAVVAPLVDWEMGEGSRGENSDPLRAVLPLLDLRKPLPKKGTK